MIDNEIAKALDALGVPRVPRTSGAITAQQVLNSPQYLKLEKQNQQLQKQVDKAKERGQALEKSLKSIRHNHKVKAEQKAAEERRKDQKWYDERVTINHPSAPITARLVNDRLIIAFDEAFFVTSRPFPEVEHHYVGLNEVAANCMEALPEWPWLQEQITVLSRLWRLDQAVPVVGDYVASIPVIRLLRQLDIHSLKDAYEQRTSLAGIGPARQAMIEKAWKLYLADAKQHLIAKAKRVKT